jgi:uncharacterized protein with HEPN domain
MRLRLLDVLQSCRAICQYTAGLDFAAYQGNSMVRDAVERRLGIIGEALNHAITSDQGLGDHIPELREIVGLRNRVIHGYNEVDDRIIWDIVQNELPVLEARITELLGEDPERRFSS